MSDPLRDFFVLTSFIFIVTIPAMFKRAAVVLVVAVLLTSCTMYSKPAKGWAGETGSVNLEQLFWDDVKAKDFRKVEGHVSTTFVGNGATGTYDKPAFLQQLQAEGAPTLSECASKLNGDSLMITCNLQRESGKSSSLSVWQQYKKGWLMVAHSEAALNK